MLRKTINGKLVELVPGAGCRNCEFCVQVNQMQRTCSVTDNECLSVWEGAWQEVKELNQILNEDPLFQ